MDHLNLGCQVCLTKSNYLFDMKTHIHSHGHVQTMIDVFQQDMFKGHGIFPCIELIKSQVRGEITWPITGISLCFSRVSKTYFYMCHVCEEKFLPMRILSHLTSMDHHRNYFSYINPNALSFSWMPKNKYFLRSELRDSGNDEESTTGDLQLLELPGKLFKKVEKSNYSEVACTLSKIEKLPKMHEVFKKERMTIQTYLKDSKREHPLLGMQHLIECICVGQTEKRYYLCTLCNITLAPQGIIKHVLSFDHIFSYFKAWHPSTLSSKHSFNTYTKDFGSLMLNFAKQSEEIHGTANMDMKQVILEPAKFSSVNFTSYEEALKELESITKENNGSSLMTIVKPGKKLVLKALESTPKEKDDCSSMTIVNQEKMPASKEFESITKENDESSVMTVVNPEKKPEEPIASYKLHCQNCGWGFNSLSKYCKHVSSWKHRGMVNKIIGGGADCYGQQGWVPELGLYYIHNESLKLKQPHIGVSLVMTFVCTRVEREPFYICFACEECFSESSLRQHLHSTQHLVHTLLYQNPWRLTFAWKSSLDLSFLRSMAWEEEKERGTNQRKLKVFDVPYWIFEGLDQLNYVQVMEKLSLYQTVLRIDVPERETYSKLKRNETFPLLGSHFLVIYPSCAKELSLTRKGYVCLLCERRLFGDECYAHVFSFDHVAKFLESFHPGSTDSSTDAETLVDFAKQAGRIHPISRVQVIHMERPIWDPCSYSTTLKLLAGRKWTICQAVLTAPIIPGKKLIPRETLKAVPTKQVTDSSQKNGRMMGCCENTSQKSTDQSETTLKTIPVEVGAEITNTQFAKSGQSVEKGNKEIPTPSEKESEKRKEFSRDGLEEIKTDGSETCQKPSRETPETCNKKDETERVKERNKSGKEILKQKRIISQEDPCPVQDVKQVKKQTKGIVSSKKDSSESQMQVTATNRGESGKPGQEPAKDERSSNVNCQKKQLWQFLKKKTRHPVIGLSGLVELQCDEHDRIYLCECCSLKIPEKDIISHVSGIYHQKLYLMKFQKLPPLPEMQQVKAIRDVAALFEQQNGYGEAQVVYLEKEIYDEILVQNFKSAVKTVKELQDQMNIRRYERPSTSAPSSVQPVDTSAAQHQLGSVKDDYQEVNMEVVEDSVKVGAEITNTQFAKSGQSVEKGNKEMPTPSEKESEKRKEFSRDGLEEIKTDGSETCQKPSRETPETCNKKDETDETERVKERNKSGKEILKQKRIISQEDPCPVQDVKQVKKQTKGIVSSKKDSSESQMQVTATNRGESGKPGQEPAKDERSSNVNCQKNQLWQFLKKKTRHPVIGLSGLVELQCDERDPIYLCECCSLKIPEKDIISHVSGIYHQKLYLMKFQKLPPLPEMQQVKAIRDVAALFEQQNGYGEAQVVYLEKEIYDEILVQNFKSAVKTVKELQDQMNIRRYERPSTSAPSSVQPVDTSAAQHQLGSVKDDYQKVNMEVDEDSEDSCLTVSKSSVDKAEIFSNKTFAPFKIAAISQKEGTCKTAPTSCFNETTPKTSMPAKSTAASSISTMGETANGRRATLSISTATTSEPAATTTTSTASISSTMSTTKSATLPKPLENITGAAANVTAKTSYKAATASNKESMVVHEATSKTAPASKKENASRNSENVSTALFPSQTHPVTSVADIKMAVKCDNTEAFVETAAMKNSVASTADVAPNVQKSKAPKAPKLNTHTNPSEPSRNSTTPKVGIQKALLRTRDVHVSSTSTTHTAEVLRQNVTYTSPASRQDDAVNIGKHQDYQPPLATGAAGRFTDSPDTCQETRNTKQQQERRDPELEDSSGEQQNQPSTSQRAEHVSTHSQALAMFLTGKSSHLSTYLKVQGTERGGSIIGLGFVWECQGISVSPFYLCESCKEIIIHYNICEHMRSYDHQLQYIWMQHPKFLYFWDLDFLLEEMKQDIVEDIAMMLSKRERYYKVDAQCILLRPGAFEHVKSLSFSEALKLVKDLKKDPKLDWQTSFTAQQKGL
ncbi:uncharacterized protein LOC117477789 isoform X6 [Trematomus bernacchii]|uniref:uncharacterized protein LOC117477789 isoform X6 n=1 Tax=Trematomus bernacchii TaxID=40690 RepID=UPI00146EE14B|nr:uncharacterized protein LOC117477789 isoform X6 [Trematomus bernacchii]